MRVVVIGAGGIGGLYGGLLARAGHGVAFLARGAHLRAIRANGLEIRSAEFGTFVVNGVASEDPSDLGQADLVLFTVKTYDLEPAARAAKRVLSAEGSMVTFQNGLDAPDQVAAIVGKEHVLIGTTVLESTIIEPGVIGHLSPWHLVTVAALDGLPTPGLEQVANTFQQAGIKASVAPDGRRALWEKALPLIPMATITAVCRAGWAHSRAARNAGLAETLVAETTAVAAALGYELPQSIPGWLRETAPPGMKGSMARDFEHGGSHTELEALTGALIRLPT